MQNAFVIGNEGIADVLFVPKQLRTESAISSLAQFALLIPLSRDDFMSLLCQLTVNWLPFLSPINLQMHQSRAVFLKVIFSILSFVG